MLGARFRATTWLRSLSMLAVGALVARIALAQTESIHLDYRADEGCPGAAWFFAQVEERTARARLASTSEPGRTFVVTLTRSRAGTVGKLAIQEAQRITVARELTGEQCRDVASALALATALAIDPLAAIAPIGDSGRSAGASEPSRDRVPAKSATERQAQSNLAASPPPAEQDRAAGARARAAGWDWRAGAGVVFASGLAPRLSLGGVGFVERGTPDAVAIVSAIRISAFALQAPDHSVQSAFASFRFFVLRPELCSLQLRIGAALTAVPCIAVDLGLVSASGSSIETPRDDERFWAAGVVEGRSRYAISRTWFAQVDLGLVFPLTRHRYYFRDPDTPIHEIPPITVMGSAGVGVAFP
jgi:hypothetical protein